MNRAEGAFITATHGWQQAPEPEDQKHPSVQQQSHPDQLVGSGFPPQLADQIGAEEGDRVGQGTNSDHHRPRTDLPQLEKSRQTENVEHSQGSEEQPCEQQEHPVAARLERSSHTEPGVAAQAWLRGATLSAG